MLKGSLKIFFFLYILEVEFKKIGLGEKTPIQNSVTPWEKLQLITRFYNIDVNIPS